MNEVITKNYIYNVDEAAELVCCAWICARNTNYNSTCKQNQIREKQQHSVKQITEGNTNILYGLAMGYDHVYQFEMGNIPDQKYLDNKSQELGK